MTKWFENSSMVGDLWFARKMSWEDMMKTKDWLWANKHNKSLMDEIYDKLVYMVQNIDRVQSVRF